MNIFLKMTFPLLGLILLTNCSTNKFNDLNPKNGRPKSTELKALTVPNGITLPKMNDKFLLPPKPPASNLTHDSDIYPPLQPLALLPDTQAHYVEQKAQLVLNSTVTTKILWQQLISALTEESITIVERDVEHKSIKTNWVAWQEKIGKNAYSARYHIYITHDTKPIITCSLIELKCQPRQEEKAHIIQQPSPHQQRQYTVLMFNRIVVALKSSAKPAKFSNDNS